MKTYQQQDDKEPKQFLSKIWEQKDQNRKSEWMSNIEKELEGLKEGSKVKIHLEQHSKKVTNWKTQVIMAYMDTGLKNSLPSMTDWLSK